MAKKEIPEKMVKVRIDNYNLDKSGERVNNIIHFKAHMDEFTRKLESATGSLNEFTFTLRNIDKDISNDKSYAGSVQTVMTKPENEAILLDAIKSIKSENESKSGWNDYNVHSYDVPVRKGLVDLHGKEAFDLAEKQIKAMGGEIWRDPTKKRPDRARFYYPDESADPNEKRRMYNSTFSSAKKASRREEERRQAEEEKRKEREEVIKRKEQEKLEKAAEKRNEEAKKGQKKAKQAKKVQRKKAFRKGKKVVGIISTVLGVLVTIADIVRRILTNTLERAAETKELAVKANVLGVGTAYAKGLDFFDTAHGLGKDAHLNAIQSVQNMFGDVTNLDENALGVLARVMGNSVADMVRSGMGGKEPLELLDNILDAYFKQYKEGKNSLGQYVGTEQAKRELTTVLNGISPEIANLFAHMVKDYESGNFGAFDNSKEWRETTTVHTGDNAVNALVEKLGDSFNKWKSFWGQATWSVILGISDYLNKILNKMMNMRTFLTEGESLALDRKNRDLDEKAYARNRKVIDAQNAVARKVINADAEEAGLSVSVTAEELGLLLNYDSANKETKAKIDKYFEAKGIKGDKRAKAEKLAKKEAWNPEAKDAILIAGAYAMQNYLLEKEINKAPGDKIADLSAYGYVEAASDARSMTKRLSKEREYYYTGGAASGDSLDTIELLGEGYMSYLQKAIITYMTDTIQSKGTSGAKGHLQEFYTVLSGGTPNGTEQTQVYQQLQRVLGADKFAELQAELKKTTAGISEYDQNAWSKKYSAMVEVLSDPKYKEAAMTFAFWLNKGMDSKIATYIATIKEGAVEDFYNSPAAIVARAFDINQPDLSEWLAGKTGTLSVSSTAKDAQGRITLTLQLKGEKGEDLGKKTVTVDNMDNVEALDTIKLQVSHGNIYGAMEN